MKTLTTKLAAKWLYEKHPIRLEDAWVQFLKNNRRKDRNPAFRIPYTNISGEAYYILKDLNEFFVWDRYRVNREISNNRYAGMERFQYELHYDDYGFKRGTDFRLVNKTYKNEPYLNLTFLTARAIFKLTIPEVRHLVDSLNDFLKEHEQKPEQSID